MTEPLVKGHIQSDSKLKDRYIAALEEANKLLKLKAIALEKKIIDIRGEHVKDLLDIKALIPRKDK